MNQRAYSLFDIKSVDAEQRIVEGIASTPELDRQGDSMASDGAQFKLPMPLLWQHHSDQPIGHVIAANVSPTGIRIKAQLAKIAEPGALKDRLDMAWQSIKAKLVGGLSIGWRPLADPVMTKGHLVWPKWEWLELSAVTIPANQSASIALVKSLDALLKGAIPFHSTPTTTIAWSAADALGNMKPGNEKVWRMAFAWYDSAAADPNGDGYPDAKSAYKLPHHEVSVTGAVGAANVTACSAAIASLNGARGGANIPDADRAGVHAHLAHHLMDAGMTPPPLKAFAASGVSAAASHAGVSALPRTSSMKISEELTAERETLQTKSARLEALVNKATAEGGLEAEETTEQAALETEIGSLTARVKTLSTLEAAQAAQASGLSFTPAATRPTASLSQANVALTDLPKGTRFARYAMAVAAGKGSYSDTVAYAKRFTNTPEVLAYIKAQEGTAVVQSPGWGGALVNPNTIATEFVELLNPMTIIGRVAGFRRVPFNIPIITQLGHSTIGWVGEGGTKGVSELAFDRTTLTFAKVAGIVVLTDELIRLSTPSAEATVRQDLLEQAAVFLDEQFIQVAIAATANSPASITFGVSSPAATGTDYIAVLSDLNAALATFDNAFIPTDGLTIVMTPALCRGISSLTTPLGTRAFDTMTPSGGTLMGYPVLASASVDAGTVVIFKSSEIFLADDGQVTLDASNQATLDMNGGSPNSPTFNLWQQNCVGIRAERWIRWQPRRADVVAVIDSAAYGPSVGSP